MLKLDSSDDAIFDEFCGAANLERRGMAGEVSTWRTKQTKPSQAYATPPGSAAPRKFVSLRATRRRRSRRRVD